MTWISESSGMWFPHQVRKLVDPLDKKIEELQCELNDEHATKRELLDENADYYKAITDALDVPHSADPQEAVNQMTDILSKAIK